MSGDLYAPGRTFSLTVLLWRPHTGYRALRPTPTLASLRDQPPSYDIRVQLRDWPWDFNGRLLLTKHDTVTKTAERIRVGTGRCLWCRGSFHAERMERQARARSTPTGRIRTRRTGIANRV